MVDSPHDCDSTFCVDDFLRNLAIHSQIQEVRIRTLFVMTQFTKTCLKPLVVLSMAILLLSNVSLAQARPSVSDKEQVNLQRILYALNASNEILSEAQRNADKQDRFRFSYHCLILDINLVKKGLHTAINGTQTQAFQNQELCIEYGFAGHFGNESALLQQYINELQSLLPIVHETSSYVNQQQRTRFNYNILSSDIKTIIMGIERSLIGSGDALRQFPALRGKYSQ